MYSKAFTTNLSAKHMKIISWSSYIHNLPIALLDLCSQRWIHLWNHEGVIITHLQSYEKKITNIRN